MSTTISQSLPNLDYGPGWTITVESDQAATKITKLNVYGFSPAKDTTPTAEPFTPLFSYGRPN